MDMSTSVMIPVTLEKLPRRQPATVAGIDWAQLAVPEARRLRELGFDEGVAIEVLHRATLGSGPIAINRSEAHTSELQSLMRISYAVFCLKKNTTTELHTLHLTH